MNAPATPTYNVSDIAKYFVRKSYEKRYDEGMTDGLTNLRLQKLVYFAQAAKLVRDARPLFKEKIEAWKYGPVVPELYKELRSFGNNVIPESYAEGMTSIEAGDTEILDEIWGKLSEASTSRLVDLTHRHDPWKIAYANGENTEISHQSLVDFYQRLFSVSEDGEEA